jgi:hypothetical protein
MNHYAHQKTAIVNNTIHAYSETPNANSKNDLLIRTLERKINPLESGMVQFSYCSMETTNCMLGLHCTCLKQKAFEDEVGFIEIKP